MKITITQLEVDRNSKKLYSQGEIVEINEQRLL